MKRAAVFLFSVFLLNLASADEVLPPPNREGWGEKNPAEALLNLNHDPNTVKKDDEELDLRTKEKPAAQKPIRGKVAPRPATDSSAGMTFGQGKN